MPWLPAPAELPDARLDAPSSAPVIRPATAIWSESPASRFFESSVLGNGRLGAMVFGGVGKERVVLNESTMWSGSPQDADREDARLVLPKIRGLLLAGENAEAEELVNRTFVCKGPGSGGPVYGTYQTFGDLVVESPEREFTDYRRVLDLDAATATVSYRSGGATFTREAFASAPANAIVYRYRADRRGRITFDAKLTRPERAITRTDGNDFILGGQLDSGQSSIEGVRYEGRLRVVAKGGKVSVDASGIHVRGADEATLIFSAATNMFDAKYAETARRSVDQSAPQSFATLRDAATKDHRRFFRRVAIELPEGPAAQRPTIERLAANVHGPEDPSLAALYFNFGRYLLIGSSRPDSPLPANLQGLWAEELHTPWNGDFHLDINVQMNYWPAETTNLADCHRPLLDFVRRLVPNGERTARAYYGAKGWVSHTISNPWHFTSPGEGASWGAVNTTGAWLCEHLWQHYAFTGDKAYLASVYPTMRGAAEFFLDMLIAEPKHGWLVTAPSNSPENHFRDPKSGKDLAICMGPTMDMSILRELFANVAAASKALGTDDAFRARVEAARARLAPYQIGQHGQIQEWLEDYDEPEPHHRHTSNLYGLYPYDEISPDRTPELARAADTTLTRRGDGATGWAMAWRIAFAARLRDGEHAWRLLKGLLRPIEGAEMNYTDGGGSYPNLFCAHPPFQIDGNFGGTAAIAEMLVQSREGEVSLLPALPAAWSSGSVRGLRARGGITVDVAWKDRRVTSYRIEGPGAKGVRVRLPQ